MENKVSSNDILEFSKQMIIVAKDLEKLGKLEAELNNSSEENKIIISYNKKLKTEKNEIARRYNDLKTKNSNLEKRIEKLEKIYSTIPGTTKEDKNRFLEFCAIRILPEIFKEVKSKQYKMVERHWNLYHESPWIEIKKKVVEQQCVVKMVMYLLYAITNNLKVTKLDNIIEEFFTKILLNNIDLSKEILFDSKKVMENIIVKEYGVIDAEVIEEAVEIFNYYSDILVNNLEKIKRGVRNIELYEYGEYMYDTAVIANNMNREF